MKITNTSGVLVSVRRSTKQAVLLFAIGCIYLFVVNLNSYGLPEPMNDQDLIISGIWLTLGVVMNFLLAMTLFVISFVVNLGIAIRDSKQ